MIIDDVVLIVYIMKEVTIKINIFCNVDLINI